MDTNVQQTQIPFLTSDQLLAKCKADQEFLLKCKAWNGGFKFTIDGNEAISIKVENGQPVEGAPQEDGLISFSGPAQLWGALFMSVPPRMINDIAVAMVIGIEMQGDETLFCQYYPAIMRAIELMRPTNEAQTINIDISTKTGQHDAPVGRYINVEILGDVYRIYYEEAGQGIPLLCHHTAGSHGSQWRHILENKAITDNFKVIVYDIPYHGKSMPPSGKTWWQEEYKLTAEFVRQIPITIAKALNLDNPVFMGCSVGGALALDLAVNHPEHFRGVISVEGGLHFGGDMNDTVHTHFYHPQVSNEFKGRLMHALTSPTSPEAYRRETVQQYSSGWPPAFIGDLNYYDAEYDIRETAKNIDTSKIRVTILNGEYDFSGSWEKGEEAHNAIPGSEWVKMMDVGHFPMSENPEAFISYLLPVLEGYLK